MGRQSSVNQDLEAVPHCVTARNLSSWSIQLPWIEYMHNSLISAVTGMTLFECSLGYLPPLFPSQENEIAVPSVQSHLCRCCKVWRDASSIRLTATNAMPPVTKPLLPTTNQVRKFGFDILLKNSLAHIKLTSLSILLLLNLRCQGLWVFIPPSMCPSWNLFLLDHYVPQLAKWKEVVHMSFSVWTFFIFSCNSTSCLSTLSISIYSFIEKEMLALILALQLFSLYSISVFVVVFTDHNPLISSVLFRVLLRHWFAEFCFSRPTA